MNIELEIEKIKKDCSYFLNLVANSKHTNTFLYRGFFDRNNERNVFSTKNVRMNRRASNTPQFFSDLVDEYFIDKFKIPFRSQSMFCTTKHDIAMTYGPLHAVFPIGAFDYCYSPIIDDMYDLSSIAKYGFVDYDVTKNSFKDLTKEERYKLLDDLQYTNKDFLNWPNITHEIMIACNSYHSIKIIDLFEILFPTKYHFNMQQKTNEVLKYLQTYF